jgi:hypothetical protein
MENRVLHEFRMGDVEDPEIYVAQPLCEWEATEVGEWCHRHATDLTWHLRGDPSYLGYRVIVTGNISDKDWAFYLLKFKDRSSIS